MSGRIVHVSADFPDDWNPHKTVAIARLVDLVDTRFDQQVISLNRASPPKSGWLFPQSAVSPRTSGRVTAVRYAAPPRGLWHWAMLTRLGEWIAAELRQGERPALLVGHKLTVEGIAVARAARLLGVPYALTIQGDTDRKIMAMRPDLAARLGTIFQSAAMVFALAPWGLAECERRFGPRRGPSIVLPCPIETDTPLPPDPAGKGIVSAFHLASQRRKNLAGLVAGAELARRSEPQLDLAIIGGGSVADEAVADRMTGARPYIHREGALPNAAIPARFNRAAGFVLPSLRESFGMVFIEALFAGLPIAYPAGWAVDGYFDHAPFALRIDARSPVAIAEAMLALQREQGERKAALAAWQLSPAAQRFRREAIGAAFGDGLEAAITHHG